MNISLSTRRARDPNRDVIFPPLRQLTWPSYGSGIEISADCLVSGTASAKELEL